MPYRKRPTTTKRSYRKRNQGSSALSTAAKALSIATAVRNLINVEKKVCDTLNTSAGTTPFSVSESITSSGTVFYVSGIAQGTGVNQRDGNSVKLSSIYLNLRAIQNAAASSNTDLRILLFRDNDSQGTAPSVTDVLLVASVASPLNITSFPGRFTVLMDKRKNLAQKSVGDDTYNLHKYMKYKYHLKYSGTTAGSSDAKTGALFLLLISDTTANHPSVAWVNRLRYIDN